VLLSLLKKLGEKMGTSLEHRSDISFITASCSKVPPEYNQYISSLPDIYKIAMVSYCQPGELLSAMLRIRDVYPGSRIPDVYPGSRIRFKEFKYFKLTQKNFLSSRNMIRVVHPGSGS
jgi:hypothetical protein